MVSPGGLGLGEVQSGVAGAQRSRRTRKPSVSTEEMEREWLELAKRTDEGGGG